MCSPCRPRALSAIRANYRNFGDCQRAKRTGKLGDIYLFHSRTSDVNAGEYSSLNRSNGWFDTYSVNQDGCFARFFVFDFQSIQNGLRGGIVVGINLELVASVSRPNSRILL